MIGLTKVDAHTKDYAIMIPLLLVNTNIARLTSVNSEIEICESKLIFTFIFLGEFTCALQKRSYMLRAIQSSASKKITEVHSQTQYGVRFVHQKSGRSP